MYQQYHCSRELDYCCCKSDFFFPHRFPPSCLVCLYYTRLNEYCQVVS
nr:MAG TPA: hypothetical protein [Caudoviricetes sp.]